MTICDCGRAMDYSHTEGEGKNKKTVWECPLCFKTKEVS